MPDMPKARNMNNTKIVNAKQANFLYFKRQKGEILKTNAAV